MIGKSIFIWQIPEVFGGDVQTIASRLKTAGFQSAILHEVNTAAWRTPARKDLVEALKAEGITPIGGAAVYGVNPVLEGQQAASICQDLGMDTFVFDAESAFDKIAKPDSAAVKLLQAYRAAAPGNKAGWCWWAFHHKQGSPGSVYHPKSILWAAMEPGYGDSDFGVPMLYWSWGDTPDQAVAYLRESWDQWREITNKPISPAGRAYIGDGGTAKPDAIVAFEAEARALGAEGVTWWSMQHAIDGAHLPEVWDALANLPAFGEVQPVIAPPEPKPLTLESLDARLKVIEARLGIVA
jgi:hypothetical protein